MARSSKKKPKAPRAAAMARQTAGKARVFKDKKKAPRKADCEIEEGIDEYEQDNV